MSTRPDDESPDSTPEESSSKSTGSSRQGKPDNLAGLFGLGRMGGGGPRPPRAPRSRTGGGRPGPLALTISIIAAIAVAIGIFNDERDPRENLKDIPTFKEMGYDVTMSVWKFLMLPAGTPEDVVTKVTETLTAITETDEYKEFCDANQLLPLTLTTEEMVERINEEAAVNQELLAG